ncbi:alkaline shock response membrane anchor protein AmaP [Pediococcus siamensis]|uniref:alkaline shock response membrane anchor protein AmaP n=1 Tax=Pediococcus siamensis TaxID=381829 RepID=UPI0039A3E115
MNKFSKTVLVIGTLLFMVVCVFVASVTWPGDQQSQLLGSIRYFFLTNYYAYTTLFWIAVLCLALFLIALVVVLFYPKATTTFVLKDDRGKLSVHSRAIEGIVRSMINDEDFIGSPKVRVQTLNHRIRVMVKGEIKRTSALVDHTEDWSARVQERIRNLIGENHSVKVNVKLDRYETRDTTASKNVRVE